MGMMKRFAEAVSCKMGQGGEITDDVIKETNRILLLEPEKRAAEISTVYKWRAPAGPKKPLRTPEQQAEFDKLAEEYRNFFNPPKEVTHA